MLDQIGEIARVGLVGADVLGRVDGIEMYAELLVARREAHAIDIREDDELEVTLEIGKRFGAVRKGRPSGDRGAEPVVEIGIDARAPNFREPGVDDGEQRRVAKRRRLFLLSLLLLAEGIERFLAGDLQMAFAQREAAARSRSPSPNRSKCRSNRRSGP